MKTETKNIAAIDLRILSTRTLYSLAWDISEELIDREQKNIMAEIVLRGTANKAINQTS